MSMIFISKHQKVAILAVVFLYLLAELRHELASLPQAEDIQCFGICLVTVAAVRTYLMRALLLSFGEVPEGWSEKA